MQKTGFNILDLFPFHADGLTISFVLLLVIIFVVFAVYAFVKYYDSKRFLEGYLNLIKDMTREDLLNRRRIILENSTNLSDQGKLWREFDESLVEIRSADCNGLFNTIDAFHFFNSATFSISLIENRLIAAVPGFLTALGVLGTFAGLTLGLAGLDINTEDIQKLKDGILLMIQGASMAFITSFWGVLLSLLFNAGEKFGERRLRAKIDEFQKTIDALFPRITAEQTLVNIESTNKKSTETLQGLAEEIGNKMQQQMTVVSNNLREGLEQSLERILAPALEKLAQDAHQGSSKALESLMDRYMERIGSIGDMQKEMIEESARTITTASEVMAAGMNEFMAGFGREMASVKGVQDGLAEVVKKSSQDQEKAFNDINDNLTGLLQSFEIVAESNREASLGFKSSGDKVNEAAASLKEFANRFDSLTTNTVSHLNSLIEQAGKISSENAVVSAAMKELQTASNESIDLLNRGMEKMSSLTEYASKEMETLREHYQALQKSLEGHVEKLQEQVANLLKDYADHVQAQTSDRMSEWNTQTSHYTQTMRDAIDALASLVEDMERVSRKI